MATKKQVPSPGSSPEDAEEKLGPARFEGESIEPPLAEQGIPADAQTVINAIRATFEAAGGRFSAPPASRSEASSDTLVQLARAFADEVVRTAEAIETRDEANEVLADKSAEHASPED